MSSVLLQHTIGFDRLADLFANTAPKSTYPPYNIFSSEEDKTYTVELAVAGFDAEDIQVSQDRDLLIVSSNGPDQHLDRAYRHRGIAHRAFTQRFTLNEYLKVKGVTLKNGLLSIQMAMEKPEELKPVVFAINAE